MTPLYRISIRIEGAEAAAAIAELFDESTGGVSAFETREAAAAKPAEWVIEAYGARPRVDAALDLRLALTAAAAGGKILDLIETAVGERDWLAENRRAFPPQRVGRYFIHGSHWRDKPPPGTLAIEIDAATAFGTGEHPSTRGCLIAFDRLARRTRLRRPRDIGTGSGILAVAAAKTLRRAVLASDIDPVSVRVARHHAKRNGVARLVTAAGAAGVGRSRGHDLVFANILARPLMLMARDLAGVVAPGGAVILSGLLWRQEAAVLAAYRAQGLAFVFRIALDGWSTVVVRKRNGPLP